MILWLRTRRAGYLALAVVVVVAGAVALGDRTIEVPVLVGSGGGQVPLVTFVQLIWAAAVADAYSARGQAVDARPVPVGGIGLSRLGGLDAVLFLLVSAIAAVVFCSALGVPGAGPVGAGSLLTVAAVAVVSTLLAGPGPSALVVTVAVLLSATYGVGAPGARVVRATQLDGDAWFSLALGMVLCVAAAGLLLSNRVTTRMGFGDRLE